MFKIVNWNQRAKDDFFEKRSIENSEEYVAIVSCNLGFLLNKVDERCDESKEMIES